VVANVAELNRFRYRERRPLEPRLLSTRNFAPLYNVGCTIRAFARVQARYPNASLTVVGRGSQESALKALAADLGVRNITFAGRVPQHEIHRYYDEADIYVQTPAIDNMPGSVIEAFASGTPVVSTDVGGVPVILTHGVHGLLAPDNDDAAIAARILWLLEEPERARAMAEAARATCRGYEWDALRGEWLSVYRAVLAPAHKTRRLEAA
jgi:glycosyltransferase involved in cell wall biosynthesis